MANDSSLAVRRAVVSALRADAVLTALVPADRIYGPEPPANPVWPFIRYGTPTAIPDRSTCNDGARIIVSVHSFAKGPGEDVASRIAARVAKVLDEAVLTTGDGDEAQITWTGGQTLRDTDEASAWHTISDLEVTVVSQ